MRHTVVGRSSTESPETSERRFEDPDRQYSYIIGAGDRLDRTVGREPVQTSDWGPSNLEFKRWNHRRRVPVGRDSGAEKRSNPLEERVELRERAK